jgi:hypothetical protein
MRTAARSAQPQRQKGQTVLWFLAMLAACCCAFALVYNVGQVTNKKEETLNAADAAALSGAVVEARMLNFEAYANRAMIANEVTVAQLVSLDSWVQYDATLINNLNDYVSPALAIVGLEGAVQGLADASQQASDALNTSLTPALAGIESINGALQAARESANEVGATAANDVAARIAGANATTFDLSFAGQPQLVDGFSASASSISNAINQNNWANFTVANDQGDQRKPARDVIQNARDEFSTARGGGWLIDRINDGFKALSVASLGLTYTQLVKSSDTTTLVQSSALDNYDHWAAQDSLDLYTKSFTCGESVLGVSLPCVYVPWEVPLGYGRTDADSDGSTGSPHLCNTHDDTVNCSLAVQTANNVTWNGTDGTGMPTIRDLSPTLEKTDACSVNNGSDSPALSFIAAVQKSGKSTLTTQRLGIGTLDDPDPSGSPGSSTSNDDLQNNDNLTAISAACSFFLRPDRVNSGAVDPSVGLLARADGVHEYASLYNPYWQARLTTPDPRYTAALYKLIGLDGLSTVGP